MPRVNLYVREDDWEAYEAIVDKPKWLHRAIHDTPAQRLPLNVIRGVAKSKNIKQNPDGTLSPKVVGKPVSFTTKPVPLSETIPAIGGEIPVGRVESDKPSDINKAILEVKPNPKEYKFPPSAASALPIIKTSEEAKKIVENPKFIDKKYTARKPGSKERHIEL